MLAYIFIFAFLTLLSIFELIDNNKSKKFMIFFLIVIVFFTGFRFELAGYDYFVYEKVFQYAKPLNEITFNNWTSYNLYNYELGFHGLNTIIKTITVNTNIYFFIISLISLSIFIVSFRKYTNLMYLPFLIYLYKGFFYNNFTSIRQSIAIAIFIFAIRYIKEKNLIKYYCCIVICILFHNSAIILLPLYFIDKIKLKNKQIIYFSIILSILSFVSVIGDIIVTTLSKLFAILNIHNFEKYYGYLNTEGASSLASRINLLEGLVIIGIIIVFREKISKYDYSNIFINMYLVYFAVISASTLMSILSRFREYFIVAYLVIISYFIQSIENKKVNRAVFCLIILLSFAGYIRYLYVFDNGAMIPYKNYLFQ